jgi:TonB family protein
MATPLTREQIAIRIHRLLALAAYSDSREEARAAYRKAQELMQRDAAANAGPPPPPPFSSPPPQSRPAPPTEGAPRGRNDWRTLFFLLAGTATMVAGFLLLDKPGDAAAGWLLAATGVTGVVLSMRLWHLERTPRWYHPAMWVMGVVLLLGGYGLHRESVQQASAPKDSVPKAAVPETADPETSDPVLLIRVEPEYSTEARTARYQGTVRIHVTVDSSGRVTEPEILDSPGLGLDEKILEAVRQWKFRPRIRNGLAVSGKGVIEVNFRLPASGLGPVSRPLEAGPPLQEEPTVPLLEPARPEVTPSLSTSPSILPTSCTVSYSGPGDGLPRPMLAVRLLNGTHSIGGTAVVDSGADQVVFPLAYARALGLDLSVLDTSKIHGVGGSSLVYSANIRLGVGLCGQWQFYSATVGFSAGVDDVGGLLGQQGFLDRFEVAFDRAHNQFSVKVAR